MFSSFFDFVIFYKKIKFKKKKQFFFYFKSRGVFFDSFKTICLESYLIFVLRWIKL